MPALRFSLWCPSAHIFYQSCLDSNATDRFRLYFYSPPFSRDDDKAKPVQRQVETITGVKEKRKLRSGFPAPV